MTRVLRSRRRPTCAYAASQPRPNASDELEREQCVVFAYDVKALGVMTSQRKSVPAHGEPVVRLPAASGEGRCDQGGIVMLLEPLLGERRVYPLGVADRCNHGCGATSANCCHQVTWFLYAEELIAARCAVAGRDDRVEGASFDLAVDGGGRSLGVGVAAPEAAVAVARLFHGDTTGLPHVGGGDGSSLASNAPQLFLDQWRRRMRDAVVGDLGG